MYICVLGMSWRKVGNQITLWNWLFSFTIDGSWYQTQIVRLCHSTFLPNETSHQSHPLLVLKTGSLTGPDAHGFSQDGWSMSFGDLPVLMLSPKTRVTGIHHHTHLLHGSWASEFCLVSSILPTETLPPLKYSLTSMVPLLWDFLLVLSVFSWLFLSNIRSLQASLSDPSLPHLG